MQLQGLLGVLHKAPLCYETPPNATFGGEYLRKAGSISCSKHFLSHQIEDTMLERRMLISPIKRSVPCKATATNGSSTDMPVISAHKDVLRALSQIIDPDFGTDIVSCGFIKDLEVDEASGQVSFRLELTTPACPIKDMGGVGKSTVAVNLAYTLAGMGARVGIFDADVYGPSLPTMVSPENRLLQMVPETKCIIPTEYLGVKLVSFGFAGQGRAIMRGPMVSGVINQLLTTTEWSVLRVFCFMLKT